MAVTAAMHLLFLAAFSWMWVEGLLLWSSVVAVSVRPGPRTTLCYAAGWGEAPLHPTPALSSTPPCMAPLPPTTGPLSTPPDTHLHLAPSTTQRPALPASGLHLGQKLSFLRSAHLQISPTPILLTPPPLQLVQPPTSSPVSLTRDQLNPMPAASPKTPGARGPPPGSPRRPSGCPLLRDSCGPKLCREPGPEVTSFARLACSHRGRHPGRVLPPGLRGPRTLLAQRSHGHHLGLRGACALRADCEREARRPGGLGAGGTRQGGEALAPTDTRSPGQYLHPDPRGDRHRVQRPPPGPHAEPAARPAAADQGPDVVRPQAEGVRGKWGSEA